MPSRSQVGILPILSRTLRIEVEPEQISLHSSELFLFFDKIYGWRNTHIPMVLGWDAERSNFETDGARNSRRYFRWYFTVFIMVGLVGGGSCADVLVHHKQLKGTHLAVCFSLAALSALCWSTAAIFMWSAGYFVRWNSEMKKLIHQIESEATPSDKNGLTNDFHWKLCILLLKAIILTMAFAPVLGIPMVLLLELDPFTYTLPKLFGGHANTPLALLFRAVASSIAVGEAFRFFGFYYSLMLLWHELNRRCLEGLQTISRSPNFFRLYTRFQLANQLIQAPSDWLIATALAVGLIILVSSNIVTLKCWGLLPPEVYWVLPLVSLVCVAIAHFMFPCLIEMDSRSRAMLDPPVEVLLEGRGNLHQRKLAQRRFSALRPSSVKFGLFFPLKRGSNAVYYSHIMERTVDGLMLPFYDNLYRR